MIIACLAEFCQEEVYEYRERTFRIVQGNASDKDLGKTVIHLCTAHIMNMVKRAIQKKYPKDNAKLHFGLRVTGRLVHAKNLGECQEIISNLKKALTVAESNDALKVSLGYLEKSINEFGIPKSVDLEGLKEKSEGIPEGDQVDKIIKDIGRERTSWENYWASITKDEETNASAGDDRMPLNRYFMPLFWDYFKQYMLPTITMWSSICLGDLNHFKIPQQQDHLWILIALMNNRTKYEFI